MFDFIDNNKTSTEEIQHNMDIEYNNRAEYILPCAVTSCVIAGEPQKLSYFGCIITSTLLGSDCNPFFRYKISSIFYLLTK